MIGGGRWIRFWSQRMKWMALALCLVLLSGCKDASDPDKGGTLQKRRISEPSKALIGYWKRVYPEKYTGKQQITPTHWVFHTTEAEPPQQLLYKVLYEDSQRRKCIIRIGFHRRTIYFSPDYLSFFCEIQADDQKVPPVLFFMERDDREK